LSSSFFSSPTVRLLTHFWCPLFSSPLQLFTQIEPLWASYADFRDKHPGADVTIVSFYWGSKWTNERLLAEATKIPNLAQITKAHGMLDTRIVQERIESRDVEQLGVLVKLEFKLSREMRRLQKRSGDTAFIAASNLLLKRVFDAVVRFSSVSSDHRQDGYGLLKEVKGHTDVLWAVWKRGCGKVGTAGNKVHPALAASKSRRGTTLGNFFKKFSGHRLSVAIMGPIKDGEEGAEDAWEEEYRRNSNLFDDILRDLKALATSMAGTRFVDERMVAAICLAAKRQADAAPTGTAGAVAARGGRSRASSPMRTLMTRTSAGEVGGTPPAPEPSASAPTVEVRSAAHALPGIPKKAPTETSVLRRRSPSHRQQPAHL
jgi:hypothetical protein